MLLAAAPANDGCAGFKLATEFVFENNGSDNNDDNNDGLLRCLTKPKCLTVLWTHTSSCHRFECMTKHMHSLALTHLHTHTHTHIHTHTHTYTHTHIYMHTHPPICMHKHSYMHACTCTCANTHTHTHAHTHTHTTPHVSHGSGKVFGQNKVLK